MVFYWINAKKILAVVVKMLRGPAHKILFFLLMALFIFNLKTNLLWPVSSDLSIGMSSTQKFHLRSAYRCERTY